MVWIWNENLIKMYLKSKGNKMGIGCTWDGDMIVNKMET